MQNHIATATAPRSIDQSSLMTSVQNLIDQGSATVDALKALAEEVKRHGFVAYMRTGRYVNEHPLKGLAIAFGVGYLAMRVQKSPLTKLALLGGLASLFTKR